MRLVHSADIPQSYLAGRRRWKTVHTEQGYTRCSTIPVGEDALITCDAGIAGSARGAGLDVALASSGTIVLPGEEYGFIGGASGVMPGGSAVFLGDIERHPDYGAIGAFLQKHGAGCLRIEGLPLYDGGSLIFLP